MTDVTSEADLLHRLISLYEAPVRLTLDQRAGAACVWCSGAPGPEAADLEGSGRGCQGCYAARLAWIVTWYDWHNHFERCHACWQGMTCHVAYGRRILHEQTIAAAAKPDVVCGACPKPIHRLELGAPMLWDGESTPYMGYAHVRCMSGRGPYR